MLRMVDDRPPGHNPALVPGGLAHRRTPGLGWAAQQPMKKYLVEFIGTFLFAVTIATAAVCGSAGELAPFAIGLVLMALVCAGGHVSGSHYNPAVTLGLLLRGRCERGDVAPYLLAQFAGAFVGGVAAQLMMPFATISPASLGASLPVLLAEFVVTYGLVFVFLNVATAKGTEGNSFYGAAIGGIVAAGYLTVGSISIGGFNPAVSFMLATVGRLQWQDIWMHLLPQILAAVAAAFSFRAIAPEDH